MEVTHTINDFASWIGEIIRCEVEDADDIFIYKFKGPSAENARITLSKEKLANEIAQLERFETISETIISTEKSYEILVREEGPYFRFSPTSRDEDNVIHIEDSENNLVYSLGRPSNQFILYLIKGSVAYGEPKAFRGFASPMARRRAIEEQHCALDYLKKIIAARMTLKVTSNTRKSSGEFDKLSSAFLFNITYNTDTALIQQRDFNELLRTGRITSVRSSNIEDIDPPRRIYVPDLIHHYQLAVGTENPMLEYISYYHIIEHFFESVFNEALVEKIRNKITHPDFSYKRKQDVSSLIKEIAKSIKIRDESMIFNEQEALRLTLQKYLDVNVLIVKLDEYDNSLVEYYKLESVRFSHARKVDLKDNDENTVFKHLSARIYQNRNSIVHSKESDKAKYTPFKDDKILVKEVPLLRFIAERIIFETSEIL